MQQKKKSCAWKTNLVIVNGGDLDFEQVHLVEQALDFGHLAKVHCEHGDLGLAVGLASNILTQFCDVLRLELVHLGGGVVDGLLQLAVVYEEDARAEAAHTLEFPHVGSVGDRLLVEVAHQDAYFGPHSVLTREHHVLRLVQNEPLEQRHVQVVFHCQIKHGLNKIN
jgi:hypothetical protein